MAETVRALRVLANVEAELERAQRDKAWYSARKVRMVDGLSLADAMKASAWYEGMIAETTVVIRVLEKVLGEPWAVTSDELPDLAAGDHFRYTDADRRIDDEDGPPADINREGLAEFNGAWAR